MFNILPEFADQYHKYVELGKDFIFDKNIVITGLTRNSSDYLYDNIKSINNIGLYCKNISYFIYENDSSDDTVAVLEKIKEEIPSFNYQSENLQLEFFTHKNSQSLKSTTRTKNLARHRNICLNYIKTHYFNSDYVIVMDTDFNQFSLDGIINSFGWLYDNVADALVGNSFELKHTVSTHHKNLWNYDCWAYRGTWWQDLQKYVDAYGFDPMMWFGFWHPPIGSQPVKVNSAFGGIGIYKTTDYTSVEYEGYDCEHVCLHKNLYTLNPDYRLCLNPSQIMFFDKTKEK